MSPKPHTLFPGVDMDKDVAEKKDRAYMRTPTMRKKLSRAMKLAWEEKRQGREAATLSNGHFKIDHDVPIPAHRDTRVTATFKLMKPGDSTSIPRTIKELSRQAHRAFGKGCYTMEKITEKRTRIWRIK